jgi:flagellar motor protein MotB
VSQQQPEGKRPRTLPRAVRKQSEHLEEGDGHLWAVSYADLLMVLLAFFVIFASFENEEAAGRGWMEIVMGLKNSGALKARDAGTGSKDGGPLAGQSQGLGTADGGQPSLNKGLSEFLKARERNDLTGGSGKESGVSPDKGLSLLKSALENNLPAQIEVNGEMMNILLADNIFPLREYRLTAEVRRELAKIIEALKPYTDELEIVVIGHSDSMAFASRKNEYLGDNFDLSSLRALRGLQFILSLGWPQDQLSAQGAADGLRDSRSLSLRVMKKRRSS